MDLKDEIIYWLDRGAEIHYNKNWVPPICRLDTHTQYPGVINFSSIILSEIINDRFDLKLDDLDFVVDEYGTYIYKLSKGE